MNSIPLNTARIPDLSKIAEEPQLVSVAIKWDDQSVSKFSIEDIQQFPEDDYRLFMMCLLASNVRDPRFVAVFNPKASGVDEVVGEAHEQVANDGDTVPPSE